MPSAREHKSSVGSSDNFYIISVTDLQNELYV